MPTGHKAVTKYVKQRTRLCADAMARYNDGDTTASYAIRTNCRRLRSVLGAAEPLWRSKERAQVRQAGKLLRDYARSLSTTRDTDALLKLLALWARDQGWSSTLIQPVERTIMRGADAAEANLPGDAPTGDDVLLALTAIVDLQANAMGRGPAATALMVPMRRAVSKYLADVTYSAAVVDPAEHVTSLHNARKSVKYLRYVSEMAGPHVEGAAEVVRQSKKAQRLLGVLQDCDTLTHRLRQSRSPSSTLVLTHATALACDAARQLPERMAHLTQASLNMTFGADTTTLRLPDVATPYRGFADKLVVGLTEGRTAIIEPAPPAPEHAPAAPAAALAGLDPTSAPA